MPCEQTGDVKIVACEGKVLGRIDLGSKAAPYGVALGEGGRLWMSGIIPA